MIYTLDEIRRIITPIAQKYNLSAVYLFGSYARGTAREDSDLDLLVDTTGARTVSYTHLDVYKRQVFVPNNQYLSKQRSATIQAFFLISSP